MCGAGTVSALQRGERVLDVKKFGSPVSNGLTSSSSEARQCRAINCNHLLRQHPLCGSISFQRAFKRPNFSSTLILAREQSRPAAGRLHAMKSSDVNGGVSRAPTPRNQSPIVPGGPGLRLDGCSSATPTQEKDDNATRLRELPTWTSLSC